MMLPIETSYSKAIVQVGFVSSRLCDSGAQGRRRLIVSKRSPPLPPGAESCALRAALLAGAAARCRAVGRTGFLWLRLAGAEAEVDRVVGGDRRGHVGDLRRRRGGGGRQRDSPQGEQQQRPPSLGAS